MLLRKVVFGLFILLLCHVNPLIAQEARFMSIPSIANNDSVLIGKNQVVLIDVLNNDSDPDGDINLNTIQVVGTPQIGIFSIINNKIQYTPSTNICGFDSIKYRLQDANLELSNIATIYIEITCFNLAPITFDDNLVINEDQTDSINAFDNDRFTDGPNINMSISSLPQNGTASITKEGMLTYTPNLNFDGKDTLQYSFCDDDPTNPLCDTAYVYIHINPINDAPIAINDTLFIYVLKSANINLGLNDTSIDGPVMNYQLLQSPNLGSSLVQATGICSYTANASTGKDSLLYQVCDVASPGLCDSAWLYIFINPVFEKPRTNNDTLRVRKNSSNAINILINDILPNGLNADSVFFTELGSIISGVFNYNDSIINFTPALDYIGTYILPYFVKDPLDSISNISYIVLYVNELPSSINLCELQTISNQTLSINLFQFASANIVPVDKRRLSIVRSPNNGTLSAYNFITERINYIPDNGFIGKDSFEFKIYDNIGFESEPILVCIDVADDIPVKAVSVISLNGDGINDYLTFENIDDYPNNEVIVFDRYWNEVFHTSGYSSSNYWDAGNVNSGTYFYVTTIRLNGVEKIIKGYINIIK